MFKNKHPVWRRKDLLTSQAQQMLCIPPVLTFTKLGILPTQFHLASDSDFALCGHCNSGTVTEKINLLCEIQITVFLFNLDR